MSELSDAVEWLKSFRAAMPTDDGELYADAVHAAVILTALEARTEEVDIQPFGREKAEPFKQKVTANALAETIAALATNDRNGLVQRVRWLIVRDRLSRAGSQAAFADLTDAEAEAMFMDAAMMSAPYIPTERDKDAIRRAYAALLAMRAGT